MASSVASNQSRLEATATAATNEVLRKKSRRGTRSPTAVDRCLINATRVALRMLGETPYFSWRFCLSCRTGWPKLSDLVHSIGTVTVRQLIPEGLAEMVPGPELGVLLAGIDIHAVTGADAVEVLRARARQLSHDQARLLVTMVEVGLCDPDAGAGAVARLSESPSYAADEIRAALAWTRSAADREHGFAETLVLRMLAVFTALDTGRICRSKAWVFADLCADLTAEQAEVVCARLLPQAGRLTTGELAARIKKLAIALDPEWAAQRYATAVRERNVIGYLNEDGTATVTGSALPVDAAAVACAHVEELSLIHI